MCTIVALRQVHPAFPLVIAANRDERYDRPSSGPAVLDRPRAVVAGHDLCYGGTWFGVNEQGVAVAVADQGPVPPSPPPTLAGDGGGPPKRSRGLLVLDALGCPSVGAVGTLLRELPVERYNPFSLLHADARDAAIGHHEQPTVRLHPIGPGLHVMVSGMGGDSAPRRVARVEASLDLGRLATLDAAALVEALAAVLRLHPSEERVDDATCRHGAETGTVSSFVALLAPEHAASELYCALGPPCRASYDEYSHLFASTAARRDA